jgi:hypothetical protein
VIETLRDLAAALAAGGVTADDVVARLGGEPRDMGPNVIVERPALEGVTQANVLRDGEAPAHVTLELAAPLAADDLRTAFGEPRRVHPDHRGQPVELVFPRAGEVTLIAAEGRDGVRRVTLRRG